MMNKGAVSLAKFNRYGDKPLSILFQTVRSLAETNVV